MKRNRVTAPRTSKRGFVAIYLVFAFMTLIPVVGLAIDMSVLYNVKGRLQAACDAAAIGAGNMLQRSTTLNGTTIASIQATAQRYFDANYQAGYWGSWKVSYSATPSEDPNTKVRKIVVSATYDVPMLFLRVLGISQSTVATSATVSIKYVTMMIVVDRSGSVQRGGSDVSIENALTQFVANPPPISSLVDGRDVVGMISFGGTWNLDLAPVATFRSGASPNNITAAIANLKNEFGNSATNTAEGLYQAYNQLQTLNQTGALNVIVLLTDGRPSAFSVNTQTAGASLMSFNGGCAPANNGFLTANVGTGWPPPPPTVDGQNNISVTGLFNIGFKDANGVGGGDGYDVPTQSHHPCQYTNNETQITSDATAFPLLDVHGNHTTTSGYWLTTGTGNNVNNPQNIRYASYNAADNQATTIRQDTAIRPTIFVIGLNEPAGQEPLDPDWLARVANDKEYKDSNGNSVYQNTQTPGTYYNVTAAGLQGAFQAIASQILRLSQ